MFAGFRNGRARRDSAPKIFQLYLMGDRDWMDDHIERAIAAGYAGFCLTVDTAVYSRRERDISKAFVPASGRQAGGGDFMHQAKMTWDTVAHIKRKHGIPLWLKGINTAEDARRAVELGVDVVYVSNHGGRQLDHGRGCIDALPEVAAAVDRRVPVVVDGGFMRGTDIIKGLARGATAVGVGRLEAMAMAAGGAAARDARTGAARNRNSHQHGVVGRVQCRRADAGVPRVGAADYGAARIVCFSVAGRRILTAMEGPAIARVILYVRDIAKVSAFYQRHFGMKPIPSDEKGWIELATASGECTIALHQAAVSQKSGAAMKLVFAVADVGAFKRAKEREGLKFGVVHEVPGFEFANAKDPAGNSIQISSRGLN